VICGDWRVIVLGMESDFTIHRLSRVDSEEFRSIRLEALKNFPEAFGSTYEREAAEPISFFGDRLERNAVFGARRDGTLTGIVGFGRMTGPKDAHKGFVWGMYVRPAFQGSKAASLLMEHLITYARNRVESLQLTVVTTNPRALRFYQRIGFSIYGIEQRALKHGEQYFDEFLMVKFLK
jgi:ribosomal protein S18 acetylase RimI-like enzyme